MDEGSHLTDMQMPKFSLLCVSYTENTAFWTFPGNGEGKTCPNAQRRYQRVDSLIENHLEMNHGASDPRIWEKNAVSCIGT